MTDFPAVPLEIEKKREKVQEQYKKIVSTSIVDYLLHAKKIITKCLLPIIPP